MRRERGVEVPRIVAVLAVELLHHGQSSGYVHTPEKPGALEAECVPDIDAFRARVSGDVEEASLSLDFALPADCRPAPSRVPIPRNERSCMHPYICAEELTAVGMPLL